MSRTFALSCDASLISAGQAQRLEAIHVEYAMPGSSEAFVRAFHRYPLDDLRDAERRFRAHA